MPLLDDHVAVRRILEADRLWSGFALADLTPGYREFAEWRATPALDAMALVYQAFDPPLLVTFGPAADVASLLDELADRPGFHLSVRQPVEFMVEQRGYQLTNRKTMLRMHLPPGALVGVDRAGIVELGPADLPAVESLYEEGRGAGEAPEFFLPEMLAAGVYRGVWEGGRLIAVAGTHVLAPLVGVAGVGNVYVRRQNRNRGWGAAVTGAVAAELQRGAIETIVLNVETANEPAVRAYRRLGFRTHCKFAEADAVRRAR